jgi:glycosyltransferase involved in cell wall biosynthesis
VIGSGKKRIAIFGVKYFPARGGTSRVVEDLVTALKDRYHFTLYCYRSADAADHRKGVSLVQVPEIPLGSLGVLLFYLVCCIHLLLRGRHDLVHVHKIDAASFLPLLTTRFRCVATSHESPYTRDKWSRLGKLYFRMAERVFGRSKATLTCISRPLAERYQRSFGRPVRFIPNGVQVEPTLDRRAAAKLLEAGGIEGSHVLFAARRVMATKGCHTLLEALAQLDDPPPALIVGDLLQLPSYTRRLRALGEGLEVHFTGYVREKAVLMALVEKAELFVFPSETEGMSVMLLEVASVGTPVVCSRIPENAAVFGEDEVLYFETGNAADLAAKLEWARAHRGEMLERAARAAAKVRSDHAWDAVSDAYAELYDELTG